MAYYTPDAFASTNKESEEIAIEKGFVTNVTKRFERAFGNSYTKCKCGESNVQIFANENAKCFNVCICEKCANEL